MYMNLFHDLILWNDDLTEVNAIIEIPSGSMVKYEFDKNLWTIAVDRVLKAPMSYNFNYGLLPQTWNKDDNDPLDIIVLSRFPFVPWCYVPCRVIGGLNMIDSGEFDYKVIAVSDDKYYDDIHDISDLHPKEREDIEFFMNHYKVLQNKKIELGWWDHKAKAISILKECSEYYKKEKSPKA